MVFSMKEPFIAVVISASGCFGPPVAGTTADSAGGNGGSSVTRPEALAQRVSLLDAEAAPQLSPV